MWKEVTWKDRPDLILHDSEGFETGGDREFKFVEDFLIQKSREDDMTKRLHAVWYVPRRYHDSLANTSPGFA